MTEDCIYAFNQVEDILKQQQQNPLSLLLYIVNSQEIEDCEQRLVCY